MRGRCMCGAVSFEAEPPKFESHACHCTMCRRWTGGPILCVSVPEPAIRFEGRAPIRTIQSSGWAERAWCDGCGSGLWYRITLEGPHSGTLEIPLGLFDAPDGFLLKSEIFIDRKPACYAFAGERPRLTEAETMALYAPAPAPKEGDAP